MCDISGKQAITTVLRTVLCVTLVASKQAITTVLCVTLVASKQAITTVLYTELCVTLVASKQQQQYYTQYYV